MKRLPAFQRRALLALAPCLLTAAVLLPAAAVSRPMDAAAQAQVRPGMTMDEVTKLIGRPAKIRKYGKGQATWGYATGQSETWFLVDFGADGKVKSAKQQYIAAF